MIRRGFEVTVPCGTNQSMHGTVRIELTHKVPGLAHSRRSTHAAAGEVTRSPEMSSNTAVVEQQSLLVHRDPRPCGVDKFLEFNDGG